jgi:hypothetical protein
MLSSGFTIRSVAHQLSCFGVAFFTALDYWGLVSLPHYLSLGMVSDLLASPLMSLCCDDLLIIFQFCGVF